MKNYFLTIMFTVLAGLIAGCGGKVSESMASRTDAPCPENLSGFKIGQQTAADVLACMGNPYHKDFNPDGRYVYVYSTKDEKMATILFNSNGTIADIRVYGKK